MNSILQHLFVYWPVAILFGAVFVINLGIWLLAVFVQNYRWKKAILGGAYVQAKTREQIQKMKLAIKWYERELKECRAKKAIAERRLFQIRAALENTQEVE